MKFYKQIWCGETERISKFLRVMKLAIIILFTTILQVSASSYAQRITLSKKNTSIDKIFDEIRNQSGYDFFYNFGLIKQAKLVSVDLKNASLEETLKICFQGQPFTYTIKEKTVIVKSHQLNNPNNNSKVIFLIDITGKVLDEKGVGLMGANIKIKGVNVSVQTDQNGLFSLKGIDENAILIVSYLGYVTREVKVDSKSEMSIILTTQPTLLENVVVVGYGTQKKVNLTGAVSVVKGEDLQNRPVLNATQSLQGMVPGLNVSVGGNTKPGQSFNLNIRGAGNLAGGDGPFVVVDGIPMSLTDVNPNDIESISVLKDAAASAIYGARAPFGVILVTTKRGKADRMSVSYTNNFGISSAINLPDMTNSYDFALYFNAGTFNAQGSKQYSDAKLELLKQYVNNPAGMNIFPEATDNYLTNWENTANGVANTNWFDFFYKPSSLRQQHNLSISGGDQKTQYFVSGGYYDEDGLMRYADIKYRRFNFNTTLTSQVTSWAKLKLNTKLTQDKYRAPFSSGGTFEAYFLHNLARMRPNISPYDLNGNFNEISSVPYFKSGSDAIDKGFTFVLLPGLELEPVKNWKIIADLNIRRDQGQTSNLLLPGTIYGIDGTPKFVNRSEFGLPLLGSFSRTENSTTYFSPNVYTSYSYTLKNDFNFNVMLGFQQELNEFSSLTSSAQDLISANRPGISLSTRPPVTSEARNHWATRGYFGRFNFNYKEKYLLEINGRYDGSSRFASDSRWGFFPSFSVGYNIAREDFMQSLSPVLNNLKIRGSYGSLGNQSGAGLYSYIQAMGVAIPGINGAGPGWFFQNGREGVINAPAPFNIGTTWEKVYTKNLGLDFDMFSSRLTGTAEVYERETKDMLGPTFDIADLFGGAVPASNNANLRTKGWELSLSYRGKIGKEIKFSTGIVLSDNVTEVTKYQNPTFTDPAGAWYVGKKAGEIWGYRSSGLIQNDAEATAYNLIDRSFLSPIAWKPGDVKYLDLNNDNKVNRGNNRLGDMGDLSIIGNTSARYAYSFNGSLEWKGFSLYLLLQGIGKRDFAPGVGEAYFWGAGALAQVSVFKQHLDYWTPTNPNAYYPNPYASPAGSINSFINKTQQVADRYIQNAAYLRLKNATISYSLPKNIINRFKLSKVSVFATGENLFTITKLARMFDPETLTGSTSAGKIYPLTQVYSFGLNIGF